MTRSLHTYELTRIPSSDQYPGMTTIIKSGKTWKIFGDFSEEECLEAIQRLEAEA